MVVFHGYGRIRKTSPSQSLIWNPKITQLKWKISFQSFFLVFHLNFPGCILPETNSKSTRKIDGWKMKPPFGMAYFRVGELLVSGSVHPGRLTWNIVIELWKIMFLSKWVICMFHVNLPGCNPLMSRFQGSAIAVSCRSAKTPKPWATPMHSPSTRVEWFGFFGGGEIGWWCLWDQHLLLRGI